MYIQSSHYILQLTQYMSIYLNKTAIKLKLPKVNQEPNKSCFMYVFNMEWEEEVRLLCVEDLEGRGILRKSV